MILPALLAFLLSPLLLLGWKAPRPRAAAFALGGGLLLLALAGSSFLASALLGPLQNPYLAAPPPRWGSRNAILLLGAGNQRCGARIEPLPLGLGRILEAARLYQACRGQGRACTVLVSGGDPQHLGASEARVYGELLRTLGVAPGDLCLEERSLNTFQNAQYSAPLLRAGGFDQVILVSSASHLTRARMELAHFGIHPQAAAGGVLIPQPGWLPSSLNLGLTEIALHEYGGRLQFRIWQWAGRNPPRVP